MVEVIEQFLRMMEIDTGDIQDDGESVTTTLPSVCYDLILERIRMNAYYNKMITVAKGSLIELQLRSYVNNNWAKVIISITRDDLERAVLVARVKGYEMFMPDGTCVLADSLKTKASLE